MMRETVEMSKILRGLPDCFKTTLAQGLEGARYVNLTAADTYRELSARPELLRQRMRPEEKYLT